MPSNILTSTHLPCLHGPEIFHHLKSHTNSTEESLGTRRTSHPRHLLADLLVLVRRENGESMAVLSQMTEEEDEDQVVVHFKMATHLHMEGDRQTVVVLTVTITGGHRATCLPEVTMIILQHECRLSINIPNLLDLTIQIYHLDRHLQTPILTTSATHRVVLRIVTMTVVHLLDQEYLLALSKTEGRLQLRTGTPSSLRIRVRTQMRDHHVTAGQMIGHAILKAGEVPKTRQARATQSATMIVRHLAPTMIEEDHPTTTTLR